MINTSQAEMRFSKYGSGGMVPGNTGIDTAVEKYWIYQTKKRLPPCGNSLASAQVEKEWLTFL